jgi:small-conductance mechanosensitive channel
MLRKGLLALFTCLLVALSAFANAAQQPSPPPDKIAELARLLEDPAVKAWIETQAKADSTAKTVAKSPGGQMSRIQAWETHARSNVRGLVAALPGAPAEFAAAIERVRSEARDQGFISAAAVLALILAACLLGEWFARRAIRRAVDNNPLLTRTYIELVPFATFSLIAIAAFLSIDWPPLMHVTILFYLVAVIAYRIVAAVTAMAVATGSVSAFLSSRILLFSAVLLFALATAALIEPLAVPDDAGFAAFFVVTIVLFAICCESVWRSPAATAHPVRNRIFLTFYFVVLWLVWTIGLHVLFWLGVYTLLLPQILPAADRMTRAFATTRWPGDPESSIPTVLIVRGVRALIIVAAVSWLALVWEFNPRSPGHDDSWLNLVIPGLIKSVVVLLIADLGWSLAKVLINIRLASVAGDSQVSPVEAARRARLRTLLPIFRNALAALVLAIAALMVLAQMGVEIGPLIAGAGIFGVAIGFGSQTLVKDVISGVFYLMDDAFRVGEYIQSGSYKGTVESFSLRSVRLRHHRGPVFTVPFGALGAVQNLSRDWAIDKFLLRVPFNTDINQVKRLVKTIGAEMLADEELGPILIETLKMKGVEQIGEFGIELSFAFTAMPGWQSVIRRRAYVMISQAFKANGIGFAQTTVHVGGGDDTDFAVAAAAQALAEQKKREAAAGEAAE